MTKEVKKKLIIIVIAIVIVCGVANYIYNLAYGRDGIITRANSVENDYEKTELYDKLSNKIRKKYMELYNFSKENKDQKMEDIYNSDVAIASLAEQGILEYYYYSEYNEVNQSYKYLKPGDVTPESQKRNDIFWINTDLFGEIQNVGKGSKYSQEMVINFEDVFVIEKFTENEKNVYKLMYYTNFNKKQELGILELEKPLEK